jgi:hypothetical protein
MELARLEILVSRPCAAQAVADVHALADILDEDCNGIARRAMHATIVPPGLGTRATSMSANFSNWSGDFRVSLSATRALRADGSVIKCGVGRNGARGTPHRSAPPYRP